MVDTKDLKSFDQKWSYEFDSRFEYKDLFNIRTLSS